MAKLVFSREYIRSFSDSELAARISLAECDGLHKVSEPCDRCLMRDEAAARMMDAQSVAPGGFLFGARELVDTGHTVDFKNVPTSKLKLGMMRRISWLSVVLPAGTPVDPDWWTVLVDYKKNSYGTVDTTWSVTNVSTDAHEEATTSWNLWYHLNAVDSDPVYVAVSVPPTNDATAVKVS